MGQYDCYKGSTQMEDLYVGNQKIYTAYKGSQLIYSKYKKGQVLVEQNTPTENGYIEVYLYPGYYELTLVGGGGGSAASGGGGGSSIGDEIKYAIGGS